MQSLLLRYHDEIAQPVRAQTLSLRPTCALVRAQTGQTNRDGITSRSLECSMTSQLVADSASFCVGVILSVRSNLNFGWPAVELRVVS